MVIECFSCSSPNGLRIKTKFTHVTRNIFKNVFSQESWSSPQFQNLKPGLASKCTRYWKQKGIIIVKTGCKGWTDSPKHDKRLSKSRWAFCLSFLITNRSVFLVALLSSHCFSICFRWGWSIRSSFLWVWGIEKLNLNAELPSSSLEQLGKIKQSLGEERTSQHFSRKQKHSLGHEL